jgi:hypothetical protein
MLETVITNLAKFSLSSMDYFTLTLNIILFVFAKHLIVKRDNRNHEVKDYTLKVKILRSMSFSFLILFTLLVLYGKHLGSIWVQSYLLILSSYIINHWISHFILEKYGDKTTVDDIERITDNYISSMLRLSSMLTFTFIACLSLIHILDLRTWLESGGIFLSLGIIVYTTKDYWLSEVFSSFIIHAQGKFKRGSVIALDGEIYILLETTFIGSRLKNHKTDIEIQVPNKTFIDHQVELLSVEKTKKNKTDKTEWKSTKVFLTFNIGYTTDNFDSIKEYFNKVMECSIKECNSIGAKHTIEVLNNGDHAVEWELMYYLSSPFHHRISKNIVNTNAFKLQKEFMIDLSTPLTHTKV